MSYPTSKSNIHPNFFLVIALTTASASSTNGLEEAIPVPQSFYEIKSTNEVSPFDSLLPSYQHNTSTNEEAIMEDFLSKVINEAKDLDGDIVTLVNKNFWDLI